MGISIEPNDYDNILPIVSDTKDTPIESDSIVSATSNLFDRMRVKDSRYSLHFDAAADVKMTIQALRWAYAQAQKRMRA